MQRRITLKVCIIRNATLEKNASMYRVIDSLNENHSLNIISRNRDEKKRPLVSKEKFNYNESFMYNYVINLRAKRNSGIRNIVNLLIYQIILFVTLVKNRKQIDVIHSFDLDTGWVVRLFSSIYKVKYVYHIADFYVDSRGIPLRLKKTVKKLEWKIINKSEATIICTEERREQISGSNPNKVFVIHNSPSLTGEYLNDFNDNIPSLKSSLRICYIGTLSKNRFIKQLIDIVEKNQDIDLNIGGYGELSSFVEQKSQMSSNINYLGQVDYTDTFKHYSRCDLMLAIYDPDVPNHRYCAPNKIYEAMYLGKPIVVARNTGLNNIIEDNNIGYLINYNKIEFEDLIKKVIKNKEELNEKATNSLKEYPEYSWAKMKFKIETIYKNIK